MSPRSNGSGSNTPVHVVPTVPSMLPTIQRTATSRTTVMDTLSALRSKKTYIASSSSQSTDGTNSTEVKALRAQLKASQMEDAKLRTEVKQLKSQVKDLETLPAQLAALKDLIEKQGRPTGQGTPSDDVTRRLSALENSKPATETAKLVQLHSDVQAMKLNMEKLESLPEQLKQLQSTTTQHGTDIVEAFAKTSMLRTDLDALASVKEDIKAVKEQRQAMKGDAVKIMIQTAMQPQIKRIDTFQTESNKALEDMSTKIGANHDICNDLNKRNLPGQLQTLQDRISQVESNDDKTYKKATAFEDKLKNTARDVEDLYADVQDYIGPLKKAYEGTKDTVLQRLSLLENKTRTLRKEQENLSNEQVGLSTKVDKFPADAFGLVDIVTGLGEDTEKLRANFDAIQLDMKQTTGQVRSFQSQQSKLAKTQQILQTEHDRIVEQTKKFESMQSDLYNEYKTIAGQIAKFQREQTRLVNQHDTVADQVKHLETEQANLSNQQNSFQTELTELSNKQNGLEKNLEILNFSLDNVESLEVEQKTLFNEQMSIGERVTKLETAPRLATTSSQSIRDSNVDFATTPDLRNLLERLQAMENRIAGENGLCQIVDDIQDDVQKMEGEVHKHEVDIDLLGSKVGDIFAEKFDPFQASVEQQLQLHSEGLDQHTESLSKLVQLTAKTRNESPAPSLTATRLAVLNTTMAQDMTTLRQDLTHLQDTMKTELENHNTTIQELKEHVATKQDIVSSVQANDTVKAAIRSLQNQYDNISTDDLHQKMVHWFVQQYPTTPAKLVQTVASVQHDITQLRNFMGQITWVGNYTQALSALARIAPQLQSLVQSPTVSSVSPQTLAKANEALEKGEEQGEQIAILQKTLASLQSSVHLLNSKESPFVKTEALTALEQTVRALRAEVDTGFTEERRARNEFVTKAGREHDQRVDAEKSIRAFANEQIRNLEGNVEATSERVSSLETTSTKMRNDFNEVHDTYIKPNEEYLSRFQALFIITAQLQDLLESLNQNLPKGPLDFDWYVDLNSVPPESDQTRKNARPGKGKQ